MVHRRVAVVRPPRQYDARHAVLGHKSKRRAAGRAHILAEPRLLARRLVRRALHLRKAQAARHRLQRLLQRPNEAAVGAVFTEHGLYLRHHQPHTPLVHEAHIRIQHEGVASEHRARPSPHPLGGHIRQECHRYSAFGQIHEMRMHELSRIAQRLGGNRLQRAAPQGRCRQARRHHPESQAREQRVPERVEVIQAECARQTDGAARRGILRQRPVREHPPQPVREQVRQPVVRGTVAQRALTAVPHSERAHRIAIVERRHRQATGVAAPAAHLCALATRQALHLRAR